MILDTKNNDVIYDKNANNIMPIASITKLMTAMVILDAQLSLDEKIMIDGADVDRLKHTRSRLHTGTSYARHELMRLSLMSSENRAAAAHAQKLHKRFITSAIIVGGVLVIAVIAFVLKMKKKGLVCFPK